MKRLKKQHTKYEKKTYKDFGCIEFISMIVWVQKLLKTEFIQMEKI